MIIEASIIDGLFFNDDLTSNPKIGALSDVLTFRENIVTYYILASFTDRLNYSDTVALAGYGTWVKNISDTLIFTDSFSTVIRRANWTDWLLFSDSFVNLNAHRFFDSLVFSDSITQVKSSLISDQLTYADEISLKHSSNVSINDGLIWQDAFKTEPICCPCPTLTETEFSLELDTWVLNLPKPKFPNVDTIAFRRVNRVTRGNDQIIAKPNSWLPRLLYRVEWDYLCKPDWDKLKLFVTQAVGKRVKINGLYNDVKYGVILNPEAEFAQPGRENYTIALDFNLVD
jgi:hypothetical protein